MSNSYGAKMTLMFTCAQKGTVRVEQPTRRCAMGSALVAWFLLMFRDRSDGLVASAKSNGRVPTSASDRFSNPWQTRPKDTHRRARSC